MPALRKNFLVELNKCVFGLFKKVSESILNFNIVAFNVRKFYILHTFTTLSIELNQSLNSLLNNKLILLFYNLYYEDKMILC